MKLECAAGGDERDAARAEMRPELANRDEVVFLWLRRVQFEREGVSSEVVQRISEARCPSRVNGKHVHPLRCSPWKGECLCLELASCITNRKNV